MKIKFLLKLAFFVVGSTFIFNACNKNNDNDKTGDTKDLVADYSAEAQLEWNKIFLDIERYAAGYRPGPAPRALALMGFACYEACITGMPDYNSIKSRYAGLTIPNVEAGKTYHWPTVVHSIYSTMIPKFFPEIKAEVKPRVLGLISNLNQKYLDETGSELFNRSQAFGEIVGNAVWAWSTTDFIAHDHYKDPFGNYNYLDHYKGPGNWVPTVPGPTKPMGAVYGGARTFAITETEKLCKPPKLYDMKYSEDPLSNYYGQALEVYTKNAATDYNTEWIGEYWSDDLVNLTFSPGPRWTAILNQIVENEKANLETSIFAYVKTGMAISDAAVGAWNSKYVYNIERPDTYIKKVIDKNYVTNLENPITGDKSFTPPFPAYPSGHATMGGAGAEAIASVFGYAYSMTDRCHEGRTEFEGVPRTFGSLYEMAAENAWSRVLLGVHWAMDCEEGVAFGTRIGRAVNRLPWKR
ncbi:MAG: vanadium-dependent haloperoxidase [Bacteroidota bacterium]|nr:vanadium-dependent haloperoxidase [Bacteroidota bacterium]